MLHLVGLNGTGWQQQRAITPHTAFTRPCPTPVQFQPLGLAFFHSPGRLRKFTCYNATVVSLCGR